VDWILTGIVYYETAPAIHTEEMFVYYVRIVAKRHSTHKDAFQQMNQIPKTQMAHFYKPERKVTADRVHEISDCKISV